MLGLGNSLVHGTTLSIVPSDIDDCVLWFTWEDGITYDGSSVDVWQSQVGDIYAATGGFDARRPTLNTATLHGKSHEFITFDGSDDRLAFFESDLTTTNPQTLDTSNGGWTAMAIYTDQDWNGAQQAIFGDPNNSNNFLRHDLTNDRFELKINNQSANIALDDPSALTDEQFYSIMLTHASDGTVTLYVDNVAQEETVSIANTNDFEIEAISQRGGVDLLSGFVKHIVAYNRELTSSERSDLHSWASYYL